MRRERSLAKWTVYDDEPDPSPCLEKVELLLMTVVIPPQSIAVIDTSQIYPPFHLRALGPYDSLTRCVIYRDGEEVTYRLEWDLT